MTKNATKVVVVGGGFGGVKTALNLANKPGFKVQLISDNTHFEYHGALYRSALGHSPTEVVIPLKDIFEHAKNVELILDSAAIVDAKKKRIASQMGNVYSYDKAVFALGNTVNYFGIHGLEQHTVTMHDIHNTMLLRKSLVDLFSNTRSRPVRIAIVGAGPSGVELAGEIPTFAQFVAKKYGIKPVRVKMLLVDSAPRILPQLSEKASVKTTKHLHELGVEIHLNVQVESCTEGNVCMSAGNLGADLIIWTAGSKPVDFYQNNPEVFILGRGGRVVVDEFLHPTRQRDIFVLGDNADTKYSGMAQTALNDANFVAHNLQTEALGKPPKAYRAKRPIYVVTAGPKWAVVQEGRRVTTGYKGWLIRRRADLAIFKNFEPYEQAIKTWRAGQRMSQLP